MIGRGETLVQERADSTGVAKPISGRFIRKRIVSKAIIEHWSKILNAGQEYGRCWIPSSIIIFCKSCFSKWFSLKSLTFQTGSKLQRIEEYGFSSSGLQSIIIPASAEILCNHAFRIAHHLDHLHFK
jgi:hypothetical protein